ncbi:HisA/HisF-related TIM barrel protein, partial [Pseudomonas sp.]|uniref:HisA/HisF-related TIM barrel protein n=1 Tax=Pseudomonas sp. TaxID=306 RepID=UPI00299D5547
MTDPITATDHLLNNLDQVLLADRHRLRRQLLELRKQSPVDQARIFEDAGAELIHVVDLDGAFHGAPASMEIVSAIKDAVSCEIEIGGGIRTMGHVAEYVERGLKRIILGSVILKEEFSDIAERYKEYLVAGVDARDGFVSTHGWLATSEMTDEKIIEH